MFLLLEIFIMLKEFKDNKYYFCYNNGEFRFVKKIHHGLKFYGLDIPSIKSDDYNITNVWDSYQLEFYEIPLDFYSIENQMILDVYHNNNILQVIYYRNCPNNSKRLESSYPVVP